MRRVRMHKMLLDIPSVIETERLTIRPYQKGEGTLYFSLLQANFDHLKEHVDEVTTLQNEQEAEIRIRELAADWGSRTRFVMGIWEKASHTLIGQIWIEPEKWDVPSLAIGWFLGKAYEGRGFATEAARSCLVFLFEDLHAHKVIAKTRETNRKSYRVAERCGFIKEGLLRDHVRTGDSTWVGLLCYGMLEKEYEKLKGDWEILTT
jgi:RimJ/RimL family protein N-acetyltransferase